MPLATATPASANVAQCTGVLKSYGYDVGPKSKAACSHPALGGSAPQFNCYNPLLLLHVKVDHAMSACSWA